MNFHKNFCGLINMFHPSQIAINVHTLETNVNCTLKNKVTQVYGGHNRRSTVLATENDKLCFILIQG